MTTTTTMIFKKASVYIESFARTKNHKLILYSLFLMLTRRLHFRIPQRVYLTLFNSSSPEPQLEKFMNCTGAFIDVGANVGSWTTYMARKGIKVYAFEPSPQSFDILKKLSFEKYQNIVVYPCALGDKEEMAKLYLHTVSGYDSLVIRRSSFRKRETMVPVHTLDSFNLQDVGLIKIDTEGSEVPILLGAKETIKKWRPRIVIEVHEPYMEQREKIKGILKEFDYYCFPLVTHIIGEPMRGGDLKEEGV